MSSRQDKKSKEPAPQTTLKLMDLAKDNGVLIGKGGMAGNVLRIKPPLCVTAEDADWIIDALDKALKKV